ncbi:MAG: polyphosphate polymerase domain-containing protein [Thermomicrobiales bacterium]
MTATTTAPPDSGQQPQPTIPPPSRAGGLAAIRAFNRFELKYIADRRLVESFRTQLAAKLDRDPHGIDGFYPIWSRYYDTRDLRFYWEKIDGERFRRKLRIRHYGTPDELTDDTPVWVEIKQRVNRVTQKRRVRLGYADALRLCDGQEPVSWETQDRPVIEEMLVLTGQLQLRPVAVVGYVREAYLGRDEESGLRVTIDSRVRGRDRDLDLRLPAEHRFIVQPHLSVVEIKVNERVPYWLTELVARNNLSVTRISKYCQCVQAFGLAPRSAFHSTSTNGSEL